MRGGLGRGEEAPVSYCDQVSELLCKGRITCLHFAVCREELKQLDEATAAYKKVLELEPKNKIAAAKLQELLNPA